MRNCFWNVLKIKRNKKYTGDGGVDGVVYDEDHTYFIQAKRYKANINKQHLIDFKNLIEKFEVRGFFIHTGRTGKGCYEIINNSDIKLISGAKLINLIK